MNGLSQNALSFPGPSGIRLPQPVIVLLHTSLPQLPAVRRPVRALLGWTPPERETCLAALAEPLNCREPAGHWGINE